MIDESGVVIATADNRPQAGLSPTNEWVPGQIIKDTHVFALDEALSSNSYQIQVALIDSVTQKAQNIVAEDGHWIDDRLLLAKIRTQP